MKPPDETVRKFGPRTPLEFFQRYSETLGYAEESNATSPRICKVCGKKFGFWGGPEGVDQHLADKHIDIFSQEWLDWFTLCALGGN